MGAAGLVVIVGLVSMVVFQDPHVAQGKIHFARYCASCHGMKGYGNGFNAENLDPGARDLSDSIEPYMAEGTNEELFSAILRGVSGYAPPMELSKEHVHKHGGSGEMEEEEGMGSSLMPYWGFTLSDLQVWELVAFIRTLHDHNAPPIEFTEEINTQRRRPSVLKDVVIPALDSKEGRTMVDKGKELFNDRYACTACHRLNGEGGEIGPELDRAGVRLNPEWIYRWIQDPLAIQRDSTMPAFGLSDHEAKAITLYLMTLQAGPEETTDH